MCTVGVVDRAEELCLLKVDEVAVALAQRRKFVGNLVPPVRDVRALCVKPGDLVRSVLALPPMARDAKGAMAPAANEEIGRASCRERVSSPV